MHVQTEIARAILQVFPQVINALTDFKRYEIYQLELVLSYIYISYQALLQIHSSDVKTMNTMANQIYVSSQEAYLGCILLADLI